LVRLIKINFLIWSFIIGLTLTGCGSSDSSDDTNTTTGSYKTVNVDDSTVVSAAQFAANIIGYSLDEVISAQSQVVEGTNYKLQISLIDGSIYDVVVYQDLDNAFELSSAQLVSEGTYSTISVDDTDAVAAAMFAAETIGVSLESVISAQVKTAQLRAVAGKNYKLSISLIDGTIYSVVVYQGTDGSFELVSSTKTGTVAEDYTTVSTDDAGAIEAAQYAASKLSSDLGALLSAQLQFLTGKKYKLTISIADGTIYDVVVYKYSYGTYEMVSSSKNQTYITVSTSDANVLEAAYFAADTIGYKLDSVISAQQIQASDGTNYKLTISLVDGMLYDVVVNLKSNGEYLLVSSKKTGAAPGSYETISTSNADVLEAAHFAASTIGYSLDNIVSAQSQISDGTNYKLTVSLVDNVSGSSLVSDVIVHKDINGNLTLVSSTQTGVAAGSYGTISVNNITVIEAAHFAADTIGYDLESILSAQSQIVTGTNFKLTISLSDNKIYDVIVYQALNGNLILSSSDMIGVVPSAYETISVGDAGVQQAAQVAANALSDELDSVLTAQAQNVVGTNYKLTILLVSGKMYEVTVYQNLSNEFNVLSSQETSVIPGEYETISTNDVGVQEAAAYAAIKLGSTLEYVYAAESQTVSGRNYKLVISLTNGNIYSVVVYRDSSSNLSLVSSVATGASPNSYTTIKTSNEGAVEAAYFAVRQSEIGSNLDAILVAKELELTESKNYFLTLKIVDGSIYDVNVSKDLNGYLTLVDAMLTGTEASGIYATTTTNDSSVVEAAQFAAVTLGYDLENIYMAQVKIDQGKRYRLTISLSNSMMYDIIVYQNINGDFTLTSSDKIGMLYE